MMQQCRLTALSTLLALLTGCTGGGGGGQVTIPPQSGASTSAVERGQGSAPSTLYGLQQGIENQQYSSAGKCLSTKCIYVANPPQNFPGSYSVNVYAESADGNKSPVQFITGQDTGLNDPTGVAVDAKHKMYVTNTGVSTITVYAAGASGDAVPVRTIGGSYTDLAAPTAIALNDAGKTYVANSVGDNAPATVTVYAPGADGDVPPVQVIAGSKTGLIYPGGIALDSKGNIYVSYYGSIAVFAAKANGNVAPLRNITGSNTGLGGGGGIAVDAHGYIYDAAGGHGILVFAPDANGNVAPIRAISGSETGLTGASGLALDGQGRVYVSNSVGTSAGILTFRAGENGNLPPLRVITGSNTELQDPRGVAVR